MSTEPRAGRPRASSRETIAEAACELFLEQGYEQTSIVDIARRAGVSRSSFFNYFSSKSDVLWAGLDERLTALEHRLEEADGDELTETGDLRLQGERLAVAGEVRLLDLRGGDEVLDRREAQPRFPGLRPRRSLRQDQV